jgi:peptidoglycan/LPS O-acetylase OafA/YrhL
MTLVLHERYGFSSPGITRYLANRTLRIYPPYLVVLGLSLAMLALHPGLAKTLNPILITPDTLNSWLRNLFIFGLSEARNSRLVPPAWSLHVELVFYVLMILLSRSRRSIALWLLASLIYTAYVVAADWPWSYRYRALQAASVAFSAGAFIYLIKERWRLPRYLAWLVASVFFLHAIFADKLWSVRWEGFYVSLGLAAAAVLSLSELKPSGWIRSLDRFAGNLSYPVFLCHWPVAVGVAAMMPAGQRVLGWELFAVCLPATIVVAFLIHVSVELPLDGVRATLRQAAGASLRAGPGTSSNA